MKKDNLEMVAHYIWAYSNYEECQSMGKIGHDNVYFYKKPDGTYLKHYEDQEADYESVSNVTLAQIACELESIKNSDNTTEHTEIIKDLTEKEYFEAEIYKGLCTGFVKIVNNVYGFDGEIGADVFGNIVFFSNEEIKDSPMEFLKKVSFAEIAKDIRETLESEPFVDCDEKSETLLSIEKNMAESKELMSIMLKGAYSTKS